MKSRRKVLDLILLGTDQASFFLFLLHLICAEILLEAFRVHFMEFTVSVVAGCWIWHDLMSEFSREYVG